ncbi:MAG: hypothetical protein HFI69_07065 [Lachnospiraceae bacterium]|nr:hypothetical protein [Lachnospiraceae bacterium]
MYWYFAGAVFCLAGAAKLKLKNTDQKKIRQTAVILAVGFLLAGLSEVMNQSETAKDKIARNKAGEGSREVELLVDAGEELADYPINLEIEEKRLTKIQKQDCLKKAKQELSRMIPGENPSLEQVTESLVLPQYLQDGAVEAAYRFSDYEVFAADGSLQQEVKKPVLVEVTAELTCQQEICLYQFYVRVVPKEKSSQEQFAEKLTDLVSKENQKEDADYVNLPGEEEGKKIVWKENNGNQGFAMVVLSVVFAAGLHLREKENDKRKEAERRRQMLFDYAGIVSKLSLLLGAGMNISLAWEKIALTYRRKRENGEIKLRYAYEEMLSAWYEIQEGTGELRAYEHFGVRCQLGVYRKLSSLIAQNVRRGAKGMQKLLEQEEWEAYEQRKAQAKQAGEEAGTKLLLPMGIMLVIVLAILVIPAGMTLNL